jgi:hypothetical protein
MLLQNKLFLSVTVFTLLMTTAGRMQMDPSLRSPSSSRFPEQKNLSDTGAILEHYQEYLDFVVTVGKSNGDKKASLLEKQFRKLKEQDPERAASFLKGLRFEMIQKQELLGASPQQISTQSPVMKKWVGKFLWHWLREADEYLFRAYNARLKKIKT